MALGAGPAHAAHFSVYEICKKSFSGGKPGNHVANAASGVCATLVSEAVFTPMDMVKQRLQLGCSSYEGVWDCVSRVMRQDGIGAFYASYRTTVLMNAPFWAVQFTTYEAVKRDLMEISDSPGIVHATAGAAAGALAAALTTPLDVVKTQFQCQGICGCERFKSGSIWEVLRTIVKRDGCRGLFRGWMPRMLFHAPASAISWSTYEAAKFFFQAK